MLKILLDIGVLQGSQIREICEPNIISLQLSNIGIVPYHPKNNNLVQYFYFALNKSSALSGGGETLVILMRRRQQKQQLQNFFALFLSFLDPLYRLFFSAKKKES